MALPRHPFPATAQNLGLVIARCEIEESEI